MERIYLAVVGVIYLLLAGWCALSLEKTSKTIGYDLQPGNGQSEYLTVYGGMQVALALAFLWPLYRPEDLNLVLAFCAGMHGILAIFRLVGFFLFAGFTTTIYLLAATEWIIFLISALLYWRRMAAS